MPFVSAGDVDLWCEQFGEEGNPPLLLVHGLGGQALSWDEDFCRLLASCGYDVRRFDLRDTGYSTRLLDAPVPDLAAILDGDLSTVAYDLSVLAADVASLATSISQGPVHLAGVSLGGMIAQAVAIEHPACVRSLVSISASPSFALALGGSVNVTQQRLVDQRRDSDDRETVLDAWVESRRLQASPGFPFDDAAERVRLGRMFDRAWYPLGRARQLAAILASEDRTQGLHSVSVPALVIHGDADTLIDVNAGRATAAAIPDAELMIIEGMGHDLPRAIWPDVVEAIDRNARRAVN